jgi:hypothetical protein
MYVQFMLIGDRLTQHFTIDPRITSIPEKPRLPALPAPRPQDKR